MNVLPNINTFKIIEGDDYAVLFNGQDMTLKVLPLEFDRRDLNRKLKEKKITGEGFKTLNPTQTQINNFIQSQKSDHLKTGQRTKPSSRSFLSKLSLNVTNTCNLACKYCYANQGNYYTPGGLLMSQETALNAVNFVSRQFSAIGHIHFFGGEPTLNPEIIKLVCEYCIYLYNRGILSHLPSFGITTNAWKIDRQILEILLKYDFSIAVSLDGPKEIHDRLRVSRNDLGTYDRIVENVNKILKAGIIPEFECTYTNEHYKKNLDLRALMDFFYDNFQCRILHAPMVVTPENSPWFIPWETATVIYSDAVRYSIANLKRQIPKTLSIAVRFLRSLENQTAIAHYCPAGTSSMTINADGNIYACFMLMLGKGFCLGNVNQNPEIDLNAPGQAEPIHTLLDDANKWTHPACQNCWARSLCFGCLGEDLAREGAAIHRSAIPGESRTCDFKRTLIEVFLKSVIENL